MIKRILVGLSGTNYTPGAVQYAIKLAQMHGAELTGTTMLDDVHIREYAKGDLTYLDEQADGTVSMKVALSHAQQSIEEFESACDKASVQFFTETEVGSPFSKLVDLSRYYDLMVFGLTSVFEHDFLSSDIESFLIRTVKAGMQPIIAVPHLFHEVTRVVIAYNGSVASAKAMKQFCQMGLYPDAELSIMTFGHSEWHAKEILKPAEDYCRRHRRIVCHQFIPGDSGNLLDAASDWEADLVVMGNSSRSVFIRKVLGDTLLATLKRTTIPLFLA